MSSNGTQTKIVSTQPAASNYPTLNETPPPATPGAGLMTAALVLLTIGTLYFGRDIFVPFTLAILLSFLLAPLVNWLRRLHIPRAPAVILVVTFAFSVIAGLSFLVATQMVNLANNLPSYQQTMLEKIRSIRSAAPGGGALDRTTKVVEALGEELSAADDETLKRKAATGKKKQEPMPVVIQKGNQSTIEAARAVIAPLIGPLGTAGIVIVFVIFVLLQPSDLRDRFIRLAGSDLHRTTEGINEAAARVSRYLVMQLVVNATYGIPIGIGLYFIGVPGAFLWALLATLLRFIPYLGPFIAAIFPLVLAFAVEPGWSMFLWTLALVLTLELISNNLVEPWLYGSSTGMTPVAIILSAIFWTLLWGPVGLMMATPLTVCLVVLGRYVPQLKFLDVLLGSEPVLTPEERMYQRLLTGDVEEAIEVAEAQVEQCSLLEFYDTAGLATLRLAEHELDRSSAGDERAKVAEGMKAVIDDLREHAQKNGVESGKGSEPRWHGAVLCIAGRDELDGAAATMLAHGLDMRGVETRIIPAGALTLNSIANIDLVGVEVVCVCYLNPTPYTYARFVSRRLKRRAPGLKVVLCLWNLAPNGLSIDQAADELGADAAVANVSDALRDVVEMTGRADVPAMVPAPIPADEQQRLEALYSSGALDVRHQERFDEVARKLASAFDVPIALVSMIDDQSQRWLGAVGLPDELEKERRGTRESSICGHVVAGKSSLLVEDVLRDPRFAGNGFLRAHGIRFYAGVPLRVGSGHVIGSLCLMDHQPRSLNERELKLLQVIADELMAEVEAQYGNAPTRDERPAAGQSDYSGTDPGPAPAS